MDNKTVRISHGDIAVTESAGRGMPVVLIHGNSCCKEVFANQLAGPMADTYRMIAFDLPGHGASSDAVDPQRTYTMAGYADATLELLRELGVDQAAVYGWSLGGHIAIELLPRFPGLIGLMLSATPPVHPTPESLMGGYRPHPMVPLIGKEVLTEEEADLFGDTVFGAANTDHFRRALRRTDGRARRIVIETAFDPTSSDQQALAEDSGVPIAFVNGADDPIINTDYIGSLTYASLWEQHCFALRGVGHAPFLTNPATFNPIFERFLEDMAQASQRRRTVNGSKTAAA